MRDTRSIASLDVCEVEDDTRRQITARLIGGMARVVSVDFETAEPFFQLSGVRYMVIMISREGQ